MKKSINLKVLYIEMCLIFYQIPSIFSQQNYSDFNPLEKFITFPNEKESPMLADLGAIRNNTGQVFLVMDSQPPIITWIYPIQQFNTINSNRKNIKAKVKSISGGINSVNLYLNDVLYGEPEMEPSPTELGCFIISKTINFEPGENSIYLVATNNDGSAKSEKRYFSTPIPLKSLDSMATSLTRGVPIISWTNPSVLKTNLTSQKASIKAKVKSISGGINSVNLYLNDVLYGEPEMEPSPTELGCFIISKTINFEPGENSLYIAAVNNAGSSKSEKIFFTVPDNLKIITTKTDLPKPPAIAWDTPSGKNTALKSSSTNIKASIKTPFRLTSVVLYLNGVSQGEMEIKSLQNEPDSYTIEKTINFKQVENNIYLVAISLAGNTTSESRSFICPPSSLQKDQLTSQTAPKTNNEVVNNQPAKQVANQPISASPETRNEVVAIPPAKSVTAQPLSAAPVITWTSPSSPHTTLDTYNGTVKAKIKSNSGIKSVLLYLNGISKGEADIQPLPAEPGTYLLEKNINFSPGENSIYLVATNNEGSNKSDERYFSNPAAIPPVITWSNPNTPNSLANTESLVISACINSPTELKSVKLLVNGNILTEDNVFQAAASGDCSYNWQSTVILREGDNSIFIIAANVAGSTTSVKRSIKFQPAIAEKRLALIIGNSDYKNSATLKNPVNDANLMEGTLKDIGFEVIKHLNAGKDEMMSAIREFENKIANYNVALFYYAGHGNQVDGKNYLIPIDAKLEKPTDCRFEAVEVDLIVEEFERYQDNTNIVILDACRNNPFASWARGGEAGFKMMSFTSGTIVAFATSEGTTAADGKGANGLYTEELVKQILIPQSISSVFMNTRVQVRKLSGNTQVPLEVNKLNGDFFFRK